MVNKFISTFLILLIAIMCVSCTNTNREIHDIEIVDTVQNEEKIEIKEEEAVPDSDEELVEDSIVIEEEVVEETTEETTEKVEAEKVEIIMYFDEKDVIAAARVLYNECRGVPSTMEKACVIWTACNRVDFGGYGNTVYDVLTAEGQFAYDSYTPIDENLYALALDVLTRWNNEKNGISDVGRVLPPEYLWFNGDGEHNWFRNNFNSNITYWDYSFPNPYVD